MAHRSGEYFCATPKSIFRATQNVFKQYNIHLHTTGTIFCQYEFLFFATLKYLANMGLSFRCHLIFLLPQQIFVT